MNTVGATVGATIAGIAVSLRLACPGIALFLNPIIEETGRSPEALMGHACFCVYPISLLLGSIATGCLFQGGSRKGIFGNAKYLPGL